MKQHGVSLIELLVALLLGLVLIAGIGHLFMSANRTYLLQEELSRIQENARVAMDILARDIRMAGFTGCPGQSALANAISANSSDREWMAHFDKGILGIPASDKSRVDSNAQSDIIVIHKLDPDYDLTVTSHNTSTAILTSSQSHGLREGNVLALVSQNCDQVSVFKATGNTSGSSIEHVALSGATLFNCTSQLQGAYNCLSGSTGSSLYNHKSAIIAPLSSTAYYLRDSNGVSNLYRKTIGETATGRTNNAAALIEGIEGLSFMYGYDSSGDQAPDQYRTASSIGLFSNDWSNVVSVRIELLVRSFTEVADQPQPYFFAGSLIAPEDRFLRQNFVTTVELRNRGQQ